MSPSKQLLVPWLMTQINSGKYPGVQWTNVEKKEFCIPWKHALRQDSSDTDFLIFKAWAEVSGNGRAQGDPSVWKRNFRSALRAKGFKMVEDNKNETAHPHKVYRWPDESASRDSSQDILQQSLQGLSLSPEADPTNTAFQTVPEQKQLHCQPVIGGDALLGQQQYLATLEGAADVNAFPEQLEYPLKGAEGGACDEQLAEQFLQIMNQTNNGDRFTTHFKISVYYRGVKVLEQAVENEAGFRLVYSPDLTGTALDYESGLTMVYLPNPSNVVDQTQAKLTQCILDKLGCGLEIGVSGYVVYGHRQGEVKAFWSFSRFDQMKQPQEILKLQPQPLYLLKDFIQGILGFINGSSCPPCSLFLCLGEKWPDPDFRPWEKKLITIEVLLTSIEILKNMAMENGASSLQSLDLQMSLEEMMEMC
ncbi:interferon regulatory factor 3 [Cynoglossus semilaevis]|uniref:interferon regulatory factor 3 n=1 Tax=Cynoglossus semilaevis TaxID=244447 RepID=UPI000497DB85|nr:interferon regulatory factor 3-like [Cynoglossus semilaevis]